MKVTVQTPSSVEAKTLADKVTSILKGFTVPSVVDDTVEIVIDHNVNSAILRLQADSTWYPPGASADVTHALNRISNSIHWDQGYKSLLNKINLVIDSAGSRLDFSEVNNDLSKNYSAYSLSLNFDTKYQTQGTDWNGWEIMAEKLEKEQYALSTDDWGRYLGPAILSPEIISTLEYISARNFYTYVTGTTSRSGITTYSKTTYSGDNRPIVIVASGSYVGDGYKNALYGNDGDDVLIGLAGYNTLYGRNGDDILIGGTWNDIMDGGTGADRLVGGAGNDTMVGGDGNDTLIGGTGIDKMYGGDGSDTYTIDTLKDVIYEGNTGDTDLVNVAIAEANGTYIVADYVENATLTNTVAYNLTGNKFDNVLRGNAADNILDGGRGSDTMIGGKGNDTYIIDTLADIVTENQYGGTDLVKVAVKTTKGTYTVATNVENATLINTVAYSLIGNELDNVLTGNATTNTLDGGAGNDTMIGGKGNDTYIIDTLDDAITEKVNEGTDQVNVAITAADGTYTVAAYVENATLTNTVAYSLRGNWLDNKLTGNAAANTLYGDSGADTLDGNGGNDLLNGGAGADTLGGDGGNDLLQGMADKDKLNDTIGNNLLDGGLGDDLITAGSGRDIIIGGQGNDTITTGTGYDVIVFNKGDGKDVVNASTGADNTISLGGNFAYSDLSLTKTENNLIINMGSAGTDNITLKDWYLGSTKKSVVNLQVIAEAIQGFSLGTADNLRNNKIENFNFASMVAAFDTAGATANWRLTDARLISHLQAGSDSAAIGGDLAYQYGQNSNLTGMGLMNAQSVIAAASFGQTAQTLNNPTVWQAEVLKLG